MTDATFLQLLNILISGGLLVYAIRIEHRFTKLETQMAVVMQQLHLMEAS